LKLAAKEFLPSFFESKSPDSFFGGSPSFSGGNILFSPIYLMKSLKLLIPLALKQGYIFPHLFVSPKSGNTLLFMAKAFYPSFP